MANLTGFNIGANQRGILNIGSTINSPLSGTLQAVTDGDGNASLLRLSTSDLAVTQSGINRLLISADITMRRGDNTLFFQYLNVPDVLELNGNTIRLNTLRGNTAIGHGVASARLHVRGDGTNPIARFENSAGTQMFRVSQSTNGSLTIGDDTTPNFGRLELDSSGNLFLTCNGGSGKQLSLTNLNVSLLMQNSFAPSGGFNFTIPNYNSTSATNLGISINSGIAVTNAGNGNARIFNIGYTINNTAAQTGTATGIFLNATETALNGMTHNLMDLQVGGVSQFRVSRTGLTTIGVQSGSVWNVVFDMTSGANPGGYMNWKLANDANSYYSQFMQAGDMNFSTPGSGYNYGLNFITSGVSRFRISPAGLIQFGGTTNLFPALKRNGAALEVRLADDSAFANLSVLDLNTRVIYGNSTNGLLLRTDGAGTTGIQAALGSFVSGTGWLNMFTAENGKAYGIIQNGAVVGASTLNASAILQADSTTKGFLPPRGTNAEMLAIATPATGLVFYDTTNNKLNVYDGTNWVAMH